MVKADAYGHGIIPLVDYSIKHLNLSRFGVASFHEALYLRQELSHLSFEIYVFSQLELDKNSDSYLDYRLIPVLSNRRDFSFFLEKSRYLPLYLKFDTGMNRLGLHREDISWICRELKKKGRKTIHHLCSHFASSFIPGHPHTREQLENFKDIKKAFREEGMGMEETSLANSGAIEQGIGLEETHIRPGLILYGISSLPRAYQKKNYLLSRLETSIVKIFPVKKGDRVGYGSTPVLEDGEMVILSLGYGDGFSTRFANIKLNLEGWIGQVFGRVGMDLCHVFFKRPGHFREGQKICLWSDTPSFSSLCDQTGILPYEMCLQLTNRVTRLYDR